MTHERVSSYSHWIDGRLVAGTSGRAGDVFNPSLGVVAARVAFASETEVGAAVDAARAAFPAWAATPALKRARVLFKFKEIVEQRRATLAKLIASEHGKLVSDATDLTKSETLAAVADAPFLTGEQRVESLFMAALARPPAPDELTELVAYLERGGADKNPKQALADIFWALLNSAEFALNH